MRTSWEPGLSTSMSSISSGAGAEFSTAAFMPGTVALAAMADAFRGMNALVTGSSYGIGAAAAFRLAAEGANVALNGRTVTPADRSARAPVSLEETAAKLEKFGTTIAVVPADMAD